MRVRETFWRMALASAALCACLRASPMARAAAPAPAARARYAQALAPRRLVFPRDQGAHPDFRQEWWYLTGNLRARGGERFGFELTIFRFALAPRGARPAHGSSPWKTRQIYLGHFAITDVARRRFRFAVKLERGALGLAGARASPFRVWIDNWQMGARGSGGPWRVQAAENGYVLSLRARPLMPPVANGEHGLSRKSGEPGDATYYYSIPRIAVDGTLTRNGHRFEVHGLAWLDHEWGSGTLGPQESGWEWFGLQLNDGASLMFYSLRDRDGRQDPYSAGTWVGPSGRSRPLTHQQVRIQVRAHWTDPTGVRYPSRWRVQVPSLGLALKVHPVLADQELMTTPRYWEGAVDVAGSRRGRPIQGQGYVELVGYAPPTGGRARSAGPRR